MAFTGGMDERYCSQKCYNAGGATVTKHLLQNWTGDCAVCRADVVLRVGGAASMVWPVLVSLRLAKLRRRSEKRRTTDRCLSNLRSRSAEFKALVAVLGMRPPNRVAGGF